MGNGWVSDQVKGDELGIGMSGAVEKGRQRRSRHSPMLTYWKYALRAKMTATLQDELF